jgi:hypothetical protein
MEYIVEPTGGEVPDAPCGLNACGLNGCLINVICGAKACGLYGCLIDACPVLIAP